MLQGIVYYSLVKMKQQCKSNCLVKFLSSRELSKHKNAFCALEMKPCEKILEDRATLLRKRQVYCVLLSVRLQNIFKCITLVATATLIFFFLKKN